MSKVLSPVPEGSGLDPVPGDAGPPIVGYLREYVRDPATLWRRRYEQYGPVSWFRGVNTKTVSLLGPDACGVALTNKDKAFANGPGWRRLVGPFFDRGLMLLDFEEHLSHRRIMQQAFTNQRLAGYTAGLNPAVEAGLSQWKPTSSFKLYPALKTLTLDLATSMFMGGAEGTKQAEMDRINRAFIDCVQAATALLRFPFPGGRWRRALAGRALLEKFLRGYLPIRRAGAGEDLFSVLCKIESDDGQRFTEDDIINHMIFLLMAGHDTSTITISTMMGFLGQHPEWQQRCRAESLELGTTSLSFDQLDRLSSLELVIKESQRLVAPVPTMVRETVRDTEVLGHYIPEQTMIAITPHFTHHMPEYWPNPELFDPERFAEHRREDKIHRYAWQPFGGGVHKCLGMHLSVAEIKTVMHHMLQRYEWSVDPEYRTPMNYTSLPYPNDGQPIDLRPR